MEQLLKKN